MQISVWNEDSNEINECGQVERDATKSSDKGRTKPVFLYVKMEDICAGFVRASCVAAGVLNLEAPGQQKGQKSTRQQALKFYNAWLPWLKVEIWFNMRERIFCAETPDITTYSHYTFQLFHLIKLCKILFLLFFLQQQSLKLSLEKKKLHAFTSTDKGADMISSHVSYVDQSRRSIFPAGIGSSLCELCRRSDTSLQFCFFFLVLFCFYSQKHFCAITIRAVGQRGGRHAETEAEGETEKLGKWKQKQRCNQTRSPHLGNVGRRIKWGKGVIKNTSLSLGFTLWLGNSVAFIAQ